MNRETIRKRNESNSGLPADVVDTLPIETRSIGTRSIETRSIPRSRRLDLSGDGTPESRPFVVAFLALLLALSFTAATSFTQAAQPAAAAEISDEALFVALINELRIDEGLQPLTINAELTRESRVWADQLRTNGELSHATDLSVGISATWLKLGENVGVGPVDRIDDLFDAFIASPDHLANLVDPTFEAVGVGVVYDDEGRMWTTHRFMDVDNAANDSANDDVAQPAGGETPAALALVDNDVANPPATLPIEPKEIPRSAPLELATAGTTVELNVTNASELFELLSDQS